MAFLSATDEALESRVSIEAEAKSVPSSFHISVKLSVCRLSHMALPLPTTCSLAWTGNRELMLRITLFQSPGLEVFVPAVQPNHIGALQRRVTEIMTELFDRWQSQSSQRRAHTMRNPASSPNFNDDRVERPSIPLRLRPDLIVVLQELGLVPDRCFPPWDK